MSLCAKCGGPTFGPEELCAYHHDDGESWATGNRIMCDFIHRGVVASRPRGRSWPLTMAEEIEGACPG
jgi:hypothetical protein